MEAHIIGVHFIKQTVKYDVEITFVSVKWDYPVKTRIYNVASGFVTADPKDLPLNESLQASVDDMDDFVEKFYRDQTRSGKDQLLKSIWEGLKAELGIY